MARILHVAGSPRMERSVSARIAGAFIETYSMENPDDTVETVDVWKADLPEFDGDVINAKYAILHGQDHTPEQASAWGLVKAVFDKFNSADKYVFSVPMWNFGIPYRVKRYLDVIVQPGLAFAFDPETGYSGLIKGRPVACIYARGGAYGPDSPVDHQVSYMEAVLGFIGFEDIRAILVEPCLHPPDEAARALEKGVEQARSLAREF